MNIYCGNLAYAVTEEDLRTAFAEFGEVTSVNVITDKFSGRSRGFGFVEVGADDVAEASISALNGTDFDGRTIVVNEAHPREERSTAGANR